MKQAFFASILALTFIYSCDDTDKIEVEISKIPVELTISRFDELFGSAEPSDLPALRQQFPYLFPDPDSVWIRKMSDTIQHELTTEVKKSFPDFVNQTDDFRSLMQHIKYYFPKVEVPEVVTLTNEVRYDKRVILADTLLLIGLDNYLGPDHHFYRQFPRYIAEDLDKEYMISDVAEAFTNKLVPPTRDRTFLAQMIYYGKKLYLKDKLLPNATDAIKLGFSQDELDWAFVNEEPIWRNFIEQEHLYSTDRQLGPRFLDPAPYSKFGLELDNESPGRLGRYIGWQIVRSFMDKNEVTVQQLMNLSAEEIFKKANYKPQK